jgi:hypothetical protein
MAMYADGECSAAWRPDRPPVDGNDYLGQYRAGRNALLQEWARLTGIPVTIVETCSAMVSE